MKKFFFDLFPLVLFFAAFKFADDIFVATGVAIAATVVQFIWLKATGKKIEEGKGRKRISSCVG